VSFKKGDSKQGNSSTSRLKSHEFKDSLDNIVRLLSQNTKQQQNKPVVSYEIEK
jgi:hypothetical protein